MITITNLNQKKAEKIAAATILVEKGLNSAESKEQHRKLIAEIDDVQEHIDMLSRIERAMPGLPAPVPVVAATTAPAVITQRDSKEHRDKVNAAGRRFFRHGESGLSEEQRSLLTTSDSVGGGLVSQTFDDAFLEASKFFGPIFNMVHRKDTATGAPTKVVVTDGTNQTFSLLTQGTTSAGSVAQQPTVFSDITDTDTLVSSAIYSVQEADDASDLTDFLMRVMGLAVSRAREMAVTRGTTNDGSNTALPNCPTGGLLATVAAGVTQTSGELAAGPTYAQLSALAGSVDRSYFQTGAFHASPSVETFLRSQVDSTGRPLYPIDPNTGLLIVAGRLLYPNAAMPAAGTPSSKLVIFGDASKAWNVQNAGVRVAVIGNNEGSPALSFLTREMIVWTRLGQSAGLSNSVKALVSAAS